MRKSYSKDNDMTEPSGTLLVYNTANVIRFDKPLPPFQNNTRIFDVHDDHKKIVKIEKGCRNSWGYRRFFQYLKKNYGMVVDAYQRNIATGIGNLHTELHHSPFTLLDICVIVCQKHIEHHRYATEFSVGNEVMELHYKNMVGLYPLSPTNHELVHSGNIDIHPFLVHGNWILFTKEYKQWFPDYILEKYEKIMQWKNVPPNRVPEYLKVKLTMLQYTGMPLYKTLSIQDTSALEKELE
jgi:hypothetical protein